MRPSVPVKPPWPIRTRPSGAGGGPSMCAVVTRIGGAVPSRFEGTVLAVWRRAFAISLEPGPDGGGLPPAGLVAVLSHGLPMSPAALSVSRCGSEGWRAVGLAPGDVASWTGRVLTVRSARTGGRLLVAEADGGAVAAPFSGRIAPAASRPASEAVAACSHAVRRRFDDAGAGDELGREARRRCELLSDALADAVARDDADAARTAAASLVGLGPGLTPSGDDVLCGFLLARQCFAGPAGPADRAVREVAAAPGARTTSVSASQLGLAAAGLFGEALLDVARSLEADGAALRAALGRCLCVGSTSGADGLLGLVAGLESVCVPTT